jgi:hypothetical protein
LAGGGVISRISDFSFAPQAHFPVEASDNRYKIRSLSRRRCLNDQCSSNLIPVPFRR